MKNVKQTLVSSNMKPYRIATKNLFNSPNTITTKPKSNVTLSSGSQILNKLIVSQKVKEVSLSPFKKRTEEEFKGPSTFILNPEMNRTLKGKTLHKVSKSEAFPMYATESEINTKLFTGSLKKDNLNNYDGLKQGRNIIKLLKPEQNSSNNKKEVIIREKSGKKIKQMLLDKKSFSPIIVNRELDKNKKVIIQENLLRNKLQVSADKPESTIKRYSVQLPDLFENENKNARDFNSSPVKSSTGIIRRATVTYNGKNNQTKNSTSQNFHKKISSDENVATTPEFQIKLAIRDPSPINDQEIVPVSKTSTNSIKTLKIVKEEEDRGDRGDTIGSNNNTSGKLKDNVRYIKHYKTNSLANLDRMSTNDFEQKLKKHILNPELSPSNKLNTSSPYLNQVIKAKNNPNSNNVSNNQIEEKITTIEKPKKVNTIKNMAFKSQAGKNELGLIKTNQDTYVIINNVLNSEDYNIFGVLDGHGMNGHLVSQAVNKFFSKYFHDQKNYCHKSSTNTITNSCVSVSSKLVLNDTKSKFKSSKDFKEVKESKDFKDFELKNIRDDNVYDKLKKNNHEIIRTAFRQAESELTHAKYDVNFSGTTSVIVILVGDKIICANAGDSRAIMISNKNNNAAKKRGVQKKNDFIYYEADYLSNDMKPELENELMRIHNNGGRVDKYTENGVKIGPYRVWLRYENYPGLAMSRSIGDLVAESVGVISDPEILEFDITEDSKYVVIASDGIWEFIDNAKAMQIVNPYYAKNDPEGACSALIKQATQYWEAEDCVVDDITAVIIFLNYK